MPEDETASSEETETETETETLPESVVDEAERLERLARRVSDEAEAATYRERRSELVAAYGFESRIREDDDGDVLVCHPAEWLEDGTVRTERIDDVARGVEVPLSGAGSPEDWDATEDANRALAEEVAEAQGEPHATNAHALADFASNHYAKPIARLTPAELAEFRDEYYVRNVWSSEAAKAALEKTVELVYDAADVGEPPDAW
jgi:hypothetical protein